MKFLEGIKTSFLYLILSILLGVAWHYFYEWTNETAIVGLFVPINESTWEHLKLLFYPILIISILEFILKRVNDGFLVARTKGILFGMLSIVVLFYTYMGVVGIKNSAINIGIYIIGVFVAYGMSGFYYDKRNSTFTMNKVIAVIILLIFIVAFALFTYNPPSINIFVPPVS